MKKIREIKEMLYDREMLYDGEILVRFLLVLNVGCLVMFILFLSGIIR